MVPLRVAAETLKVTRDRARRLADCGVLESEQRDGRIWVSSASVDRVLAEQLAEPSQ